MLLIQDLELNEELDSKAMSVLRGGDNGNSANNSICQVTNLCVPVGVLANGPANTNVNVDSTQNANIWNEQKAGDSYLAMLPFSF